jgi:large subunit ribosomal protein L29
MPALKIKDARELTDVEIDERRKSLRQEYLNLRLQQAAGQLEKTHRLREIRRDTARLETARSEKRRGATVTSRKPAKK